MEIANVVVLVILVVANVFTLRAAYILHQRGDEVKTLVEQGESARFEQAKAYITALEDMNADLQGENSVLLEKISILESMLEEASETAAEQTYEAVPTNMFMCMDYRKITNKKSEQWKLQEKCSTNNYGIREYNGFYTAAVGSYYSHKIGDTFMVTLENGSSFKIIVGDFKDDGTDLTFRGHPCQNYDGEDCINVVEFIVEMESVPYSVKQAGTMSALDVFGGLMGHGGNIIEMEYLGYVDWKS